MGLRKRRRVPGAVVFHAGTRRSGPVLHQRRQSAGGERDGRDLAERAAIAYSAVKRFTSLARITMRHRLARAHGQRRASECRSDRSAGKTHSKEDDSEVADRRKMQRRLWES